MAKTRIPPDVTYIHESLRHLAVPIDSLTPDPVNARLHDERNITTIMGSLKEFGFDQPLVPR